MQKTFLQNVKTSAAELFEIEDERSRVIKSKLKIVQGCCRFSDQRQVNQHSHNFLHGKTNLVNLHPFFLLNGQNSMILSGGDLLINYQVFFAIFILWKLVLDHSEENAWGNWLEILLLTLILVENICPSPLHLIGFPSLNSETVKAVTLAFCCIQ